MDKRKVILVTDGDMVAKKAVEVAAANIGGRCISASAGNPTILTGKEIIEYIKKAAYDPVVVMVDDQGVKGMGDGERAMEAIMNNDEIEVLGILAVSSNGKDCSKLDITCSVTKEGKIIEGAVDKYGTKSRSKTLCGDTLSILRYKKGIPIIGIGDPGKMDFKDSVELGAPITTKALQEVLKRSGQNLH